MHKLALLFQIKQRPVMMVQVIMLAVPGAFTPTCSLKHLPGFVEKYDELKAKGVDTIACVGVNDAFVMDAWGKSIDVGDKILLLADGSAIFTKVCLLIHESLPAEKISPWRTSVRGSVWEVSDSLACISSSRRAQDVLLTDGSSFSHPFIGNDLSNSLSRVTSRGFDHNCMH